jgi:hypothetical protein
VQAFLQSVRHGVDVLAHASRRSKPARAVRCLRSALRVGSSMSSRPPR